MDKYLKAPLSLTQAEARVQLLTNIQYRLFLKAKKGDTFEGQVTVTFDLSKVSSDLFFDFAGTTIHEIIINGNKIATTDNYESLRDRRFLKPPVDHLKQGKNEVIIRYTNLYANDGLGLHSFVDTDGKQYIYSQCETYAANKILPCFDQPDLKATLSLVMAVPNDWVAIANQPASEELTKGLNLKELLGADDESNYKVTAFTTTPRIPTYLFVFIAGPYLEVKCTNTYNNIYMSCYCRESLMQYMKDQAEEIFDITKEAIKFYESFFEYPYPFEKYDSVFCPEYKFGAMENPGAVTFNDIYVWREKVTADRNTGRANTITHEAAHHWFGDLVTMKWWNDLWLNESFADFISHFCLYKIQDKVTTTKFADAWLQFFTRKGWGYRADQQKTTHPIAGEISNTEEAESIFDGITYSKGAASLKQLMRLIGEENFGKAMAYHFKRFEWSNATLADFVASLQQYYKPAFEGSPANLEEWKAEWLQKAGLNECEPLFNPADNNNQAKLVIKQTVALQEFPTLRHHKMQVAFFDSEGKIYEAKHIMLNNTPETTITYDGSKQPKAVLLNYQDEAFIKVRLDQHSINFFREKIASVSDELTRAMIWRSLFDMVRDGQLSAYKFVQIATEAIPNETSDSTLNYLLMYTTAAFEFSPRPLNDNVLKPSLFNATLKALLATDKSNSNRLVLLKENLLRFVSYGEKKNVDNIAKVIDWLDGKDQDLKDVELSVQNKWNIVLSLHRYSKLTNEQKIEYFNKVADIDKSDRMKLYEKWCEGIRAEGEDRKNLFKSYLDPESKLSVQMVSQSMSGYNSYLKTTKEDANAFFNNVLEVFRTRNNEFSQHFYDSLFPHEEDLDYYLTKVKELLTQAESGEANTFLLKSLKESIDTLERKKKGYACSAPDMLKELPDVSL